MAETIRFYACAFFLILGLLFEITAMIGVFRFKYVMNRMHASALGDTMGLFFILVGLSIAQGLNAVSLKLIILAVLYWVASPVSTHMIARLEIETSEHLDKEVCKWTR